MRRSQELTIKISEARERLNKTIEKRSAVPSGTAPDGELLAEMDAATKAIGPLEVELRAAIVAEAAEDEEHRQAEPDAEQREFQRLEQCASVAGYLSAAMEDRAVSGAEGELNAALKLAPMQHGNAFPLRLLAPEMRQAGRGETEHRATTDADTEANSRRWLDRLFADTAAARIGVTMESVGAGTASYPVTTAGASARQRGRSQAATDAAWTVGTTELKPTRNAVRAVFSIEDTARLPGLEDALRRDLRMALTEGVDGAIFLGDSGANENTADIAGLKTAEGVTEKTLTQTNKRKAPETLAAFVDLVDGKHATTLADLRVVAAVGANSLWHSEIAAAAADTKTLAQFFRENGLSWTIRGDIETATTNDKFGAFIGRGRGIVGAAVAAIWEAATLVRDPYSGAAKGETALTLNYLWNFGLPRPSSFARLKFVS